MSRLPLVLNIPQNEIPPSSAKSDHSTPLARLAVDASDNDYDAICVPLTNDLWRERWERLCLRPVDDGVEYEESQQGRSKNSATREWLEREKRKRETEKEAELWRSYGGFKRTELNITRLEEADHAIALASDWLELDSPDEGIRFDSELALRQELLTCLHLHVRTLVIPPPLPENREYLPSYARAIASLLELGGEASVTRIAIRIGVSDRPNLGLQNATTNSTYSGHHSMQASQVSQEDKKHKRKSSMGIGIRMSGSNALFPVAQPPSASPVSNRQSMVIGTGDQNSFSWEVWDCVRTVCDYHPRLGLALDMSNPLPPSLTTLQRWIAEPTDVIFLPSQSFIPNAKGYPVLSKACQAFIRSFVRLSPSIVLSNVNANKHLAGGPQAYIQYVRHLETSATTSPSPITAPQTAATGIMPHGHHYQQYMDFLQAPLQPLMDDLSSATYETFESDPVKYRLYEDAITAALTDRPEQSTSVIYVVGAGRGPLVQRCLNAMKRASRSARIYAIEKNANAFVTLQERSALEWGDKVQILHGDMRTLAVPEPADIMVSELLGSFGDNESSPECLDGAVRYLKPEGISIPASYTAHLAPLSSNKLFTAVRTQSEKRKKTEESAFETPYVVMFQQVNLLSGNQDLSSANAGSRAGPRIQECWSFEHPRRDMVTDDAGLPLTNSHNTRSAHLTFRIPHAGACHGLAGYFEAHLYGNIGLSIHPERMHLISPEMMSWFPLFFPFREPLYMPSGAELDVHIWRLTDNKSKRIWYEWHAESFLPITGTVNGMMSAGYNSINGTPSNGGGMHGSRVVSGASSHMSVPMHSPMMDAPGSPMPGSVFGMTMHGRDESRIKIGQTRLHNTAGRSSWVGL